MGEEAVEGGGVEEVEACEFLGGWIADERETSEGGGAGEEGGEYDGWVGPALEVDINIFESRTGGGQGVKDNAGGTRAKNPDGGRAEGGEGEWGEGSGDFDAPPRGQVRCGPSMERRV